MILVLSVLATAATRRARYRTLDKQDKTTVINTLIDLQDQVKTQNKELDKQEKKIMRLRGLARFGSGVIIFIVIICVIVAFLVFIFLYFKFFKAVT